MNRPQTLLLTSLFTLLTSSVATAAVTIDTVFVGDAGNPADSDGYGAVSYGYHIGTYEVTNAQYAEFLNAKASSDPNGLYNTNMGTGSFGGITRSGADGSYVYTATNPNTPVNYVSFWDAARFTNWLTNGQGSGDTETGVYVLTPTGISNNTVTRDATAWNAGGVAIASEDEWYKAAYYSGSPTGADGDGYWLFPTQSNSVPAWGFPPGGTNSANYDDPTAGDAGDVDNVTEVGAYVNSGSHYGTFDQGGNVWEWNDAIVSTSTRGFRGGSFLNRESLLRSSFRTNDSPATEASGVGFRVTSLAPIVAPPPFEPELELQVSTDGLATWDTIEVTPEMLTPEGKLQPGAPGTDSAVYRMVITEAP